VNTGSRRLSPVRFTGPHSMAADDGRSWSADRVIIAVGGHAGRLPIPGAGHALIYEDIPSLTSMPGRSRSSAAPTPAARSRPSLKTLGLPA